MSSKSRPNFGQALRYWRKRRGFSQLELAAEALTTPRHLSFVETGRSRPGQDLILRLGRALDLAARDLNAMLDSAGFAPAFADLSFDEESMAPYVGAIRAILENHEPYPGSAFDPLGRVHFANSAHRKLFPGAGESSPEELIDFFYAKRAGFEILNWNEVAWSYADRWRLEASRSRDPELERLAARAEAHLAETPRPDPTESESAVVSPKVRVDGQVLTTFSTVLRFDSAREVNLAEIRVELIFPADDLTKRFFEDLR